MANEFQITKATRVGVKPLVSLFAESGHGKSYSSLLLARGFVGADGKVCMIDTERGRGSLYADVIPGGYDVLRLDEPYTPERYIGAIDAVENAGYSIGILDSGSAEWELGVLEMAADAEAKSGKPGLHNWRVAKMQHAKFVLRLIRSSIPWLICLRAKHKSRQVKDERGKTVIIKDEFTTPIQADDFLFEMTAHGEIMADHSFRLTKHSHPSLKTCFPSTGPITSEHGRLLAQWCAAPGVSASANPPPQTLHALKSRLWALCKAAGAKKPEEAEAALQANKILKPGQKLASLSESELHDAVCKLEIVIEEAKGHQ